MLNLLCELRDRRDATRRRNVWFVCVLSLVILTACNLSSGESPDEALGSATEIALNGQPAAESTADGGAGGGADNGGGAQGGSSIATACAVRSDWFAYTVARGDSLTSIAQRSNSSVEELTAGNCIVDPNRLQVGQTIYTPNLIDSTPGVVISPTASDTVQFYLIAEGEGGVTGVPVGCEDAGVPVLAVGVAGADTAARINAALSALFAVPQRVYGQSGLVNELADSSLRVNNVTLSGGTATIELSGRLVLVGVCADARLEAQIVLTVFQFPEVQGAQIRLNGRNLRASFDGSGLAPDDYVYARADWGG